MSDQIWQKNVSGGEDTRIRLAQLFSSQHAVAFLDEPTYYLDIPSVEALEKLLIEYEGTLVFTSHDKLFVDRIATDRLYIRDGKIE